MARKATPLDLWKTGYELWWLTAETQAVMAMRMMGMAGGWSVAKDEDLRMVIEKPEAFGRVVMATMTAVVSGQRPDQIVNAATKPLRHKTRANSKRLARRGPKLK